MPWPHTYSYGSGASLLLVSAGGGCNRAAGTQTRGACHATRSCTYACCRALVAWLGPRGAAGRGRELCVLWARRFGHPALTAAPAALSFPSADFRRCAGTQPSCELQADLLLPRLLTGTVRSDPLAAGAPCQAAVVCSPVPRSLSLCALLRALPDLLWSFPPPPYRLPVPTQHWAASGSLAGDQAFSGPARRGCGAGTSPGAQHVAVFAISPPWFSETVSEGGWDRS